MRIYIKRKHIAFGLVAVVGLGLIGVEVFILSPDVRGMTISVAERFGADGFLVRRLTDRDLDVRAAAQGALTRRGVKGVPALIRGLSDPDPQSRSSAAFTLGQLGPDAQGAVPHLKRLLREDPDPKVREHVAKAFARIVGDDPAAIMELIGLLGSEDELTRVAAAEALGAVGPSGLRPLGPSRTSPWRFGITPKQ